MIFVMSGTINLKYLEDVNLHFWKICACDYNNFYEFNVNNQRLLYEPRLVWHVGKVQLPRVR